ncbi:hypothetical protein HD554DRAFT_2035152 [Boletus coccyginus]|nr:hypothetical protein HD554DRAFT_2035152 [Boletus coccyginus]
MTSSSWMITRIGLFYSDDERPPSYFQLDLEQPKVGRVLRFDSLSKIISAGMRLSWVSGREALIDVTHVQVLQEHLGDVAEWSKGSSFDRVKLLLTPNGDGTRCFGAPGNVLSPKLAGVHVRATLLVVESEEVAHEALGRLRAITVREKEG